MHHLEFEYESFATAFLGSEAMTANESSEPERLFGAPGYPSANRQYDFEAMAEIPEALDAFIQNQQDFQF